MRQLILFILLMSPFIGMTQSLQHFIFFNRDRDKIKNPVFLETEQIAGAQLKYTWRELEPKEGEYNFNLIEEDLAFLEEKGKKLFIQIQEVSFDTSILNVPSYLVEESKYHGGAAIQYATEGEEPNLQFHPEGWVSRRWDPAVAERFHQLLTALGKAFDGRIEGINLPETSVGFNMDNPLCPPDFSYKKYREAIQKNMEVVKRAFPNSTVIQYANFMPGEWLPWEDHGHLRAIYKFAEDNDIGVGGPDLLPFRKGQLNHPYHFMHQLNGRLTVAVAVQWNNYKHVNPNTDKRITILEMVDFATQHLKTDYLFWCTQEPYYSEEVIPYLEGL